jgi:hypothetical protein
MEWRGRRVVTVSTLLTIVGIIVPSVGTLIGFTVKLCSRVSRVEEQLKLIWKVLDPVLADTLHSPAHVERDTLVEQFVNGDRLDKNRAQRLAMLLQEAAHQEEDPAKRKAAAVLGQRLEMVLAEENKGWWAKHVLGRHC